MFTWELRAGGKHLVNTKVLIKYKIKFLMDFIILPFWYFFYFVFVSIISSCFVWCVCVLLTASAELRENRYCKKTLGVDTSFILSNDTMITFKTSNCLVQFSHAASDSFLLSFFHFFISQKINGLFIELYSNRIFFVFVFILYFIFHIIFLLFCFSASRRKQTQHKAEKNDTENGKKIYFCAIFALFESFIFSFFSYLVWIIKCLLW